MATQSQKKTTKATTPSIPTPGDAPVTKKPNLMDRFRAKAKPATATVAKKDRPVIGLTDELVESIKGYAPLKAAFDLFDARCNREKKEINQGLWELYINALWQKKSQPQNPAIEIKAGEKGKEKVDITGMFQVQTGSKIKVNMPPVGEGEEPDEVLVQALIDAGIDQQDAINFVSKEVDFTPQWSLDFTKLLTSSSDTEKAAAEKLFLVIQGEDADGNVLDEAAVTFTPDERSVLEHAVNSTCKHQTRLTDPDNILDRICNYVHSKEQLEILFKFITPVSFLTRLTFGESDDPGTKNERLLEKAAEMLGAELGVDEDA